MADSSELEAARIHVEDALKNYLRVKVALERDDIDHPDYFDDEQILLGWVANMEVTNATLAPNHKSITVPVVPSGQMVSATKGLFVYGQEGF